ncbi:cullin-1-like [Coffea arabica]|uniref:Cullin-1-like n=1 Tax=Coffea arabica TaxID=13443 RepID=A0A6P6WZ78_COFAR
MAKEKIVEFEEGWNLIQEGITKVKNFLKTENPEKQFIGAEDYIKLYTAIVDMCTQNPPNCYANLLYAKYGESFEEYITSTVLPSLREKDGEFLLRGLVESWSNHKIMIKWMSRLFRYIDRYYIIRKSLPSLSEVGLICFRDLVHAEFYKKVRDAVMSLIDKEREGEQIDRALVKDVVNVFVELGNGKIDLYENDFEAEMLNNTALYYHQKASTWISEASSTDYLLRAEESLKQEKDRVYHYLHLSSEKKLLERVQHELLTAYATQPPDQKHHSGSKALLFRDDKGQDLSKTYLLFSNIPPDLEAAANKVLQHAVDGGPALDDEADHQDAANN